MAGYGYAFKLSKQEVKDATPPGTSQLVGKSATAVFSP
jgi:hypothetical protein